MKLKSFLLPTLLASVLGVASQPLTAQAADPMRTVAAMFDAMRQVDTARLQSLFYPDAQLLSADQPGQHISPAAFARSIAGLLPGEADERLGRASVHRDAQMAQIWVPYHFYLRGAFSHCDYNAFLLRQDELGAWRIAQIIDTRRKADCPSIEDEPVKARLDSLMDAWHLAAAKADARSFFGFMSEDGIYLGTDATERWLRDSMAVWAAPFFERGKAWDFRRKERNWYLSEDGQTAWFEEHLDSWMGVVRGSGVLSKGDLPGQSWELRHYNLTLPIPNDDMDAVIELLAKAAASRK